MNNYNGKIIKAPDITKKLILLTNDFYANLNSMTKYQFEKYKENFSKEGICRFTGVDYEGYSEGIHFNIAADVVFVTTVNDVTEIRREKKKKFFFIKKTVVEKSFWVSVEMEKADNCSLSGFYTDWTKEVSELKKGDTISICGSVRARVRNNHVYYAANKHLSCVKL